MLERKKLLMEYGFRALMEQIPPGTVSTKVQDSVDGERKGPKRTGVYVNPGHPGFFTQGKEDGSDKTAYTVYSSGESEDDLFHFPPETVFMPFPLKRPNDYSGPIPKRRPLLDEDMPSIPKPRPKPPKDSGYAPASSTGGIEPAPERTGTLGTVMGQQNAVRVDDNGNPVPPLEAMGLKLPARRPTGSEVPKYRNMPDARYGIGGVIQNIFRRQ